MKRRNIVLGALASLALGEAGYVVAQDDRRPSPPARARVDGIGDAILLDVHTHIGPIGWYSAQQLRPLFSQGITGIAAINGLVTASYEEVRNLLRADELEPGLAVVEHEGNTGYILHTQEVAAGHHILSVGARKRVHGGNHAQQLVNNIHDAGGIAVLCHPKGISNNGLLEYRFVNNEDLRTIERLVTGPERIDEIETFNAQAVNLFPWYLNLESANKWAATYAAQHGYKGIAASDTHRDLAQVRRAGIYIPDTVHSIKGIHTCIKHGHFVPAHTHVRTRSFLEGQVFSRAYDRKGK